MSIPKSQEIHVQPLPFGLSRHFPINSGNSQQIHPITSKAKQRIIFPFLSKEEKIQNAIVIGLCGFDTYYAVLEGIFHTLF